MALQVKETGNTPLWFMTHETKYNIINDAFVCHERRQRNTFVSG